VLLYSLLDTIVDNYFPVLDVVAERAGAVEEEIFDHGNRGTTLEEIFSLRKNLLALGRILAPERDLMNTLTRRDIELLGPDTAVYFQDVYDHLIRVTDAIDTYRDLLGGALDAHLSVISNDLNQVMRTLTAWSIILMSLALIAGIYGMNFVLTPSSDWTLSFEVVVTGMAALGLALFAMFKRINWL
jgi:magnesium transporter